MKKVLFLLLCMVLTVTSAFCVQGYTAPNWIRVGLYYGWSRVDSAPVQSDWGIAVGYMTDGGFVALHESAAAEGVVMPVSGTVWVSGLYGTEQEARAASAEGFVLYRNGEYCIASRTPVDGFASIGLPGDTVAFAVDGRAEFAVSGVTATVFHRGNGIVSVFGEPYRDGLEFRRDGNGMTVINAVEMNHYLYGVVPGEMNFPSVPEAMKAQAVCARNYAIRSLGEYEEYGFDVTPDTSSQVYLGVDGEREYASRAVDETGGAVLLYDGEPALTVYSSMSGGATENVSNVWMGTQPYLCGVPDPYEHCETISGGIWRVEMTPEEVAAALARSGMSVGRVTDIRVAEYSDIGTVLCLKITGTDGSCELRKDNARNVLGFRSQKYTVNAGAMTVETTAAETAANPPLKQKQEETRAAQSILGELARRFMTLAQAFASEHDFWFSFHAEDAVSFTDPAPDTASAAEETRMPDVKVTVPASAGTKVNADGVFVFEGRGYGHGLGMSQWGAAKMAEAGFSYEEILAHYYPGTVLQK